LSPPIGYKSYRKEQQIKAEQLKAEQQKQEQLQKQAQLREEQLRQEQLRQEQSKAEQLRQERLRQEQLRTEQLRQERLKREQLQKLSEASAYSQSGDKYFRLKQYGRAIEDFNKAIALAPDDAATYINRGTAYLEKGRMTRQLRILPEQFS